MSHAAATTITITSTVDPMWIEHVTGGTERYADVFMRDYSGYWARRIAHDPALGWLAFEYGDDADDCSPDERDTAEAAWRAGKPLPKGFHRFDREAAAKAWAVGVERYGAYWFEDGDGPRYDTVLQLGLGVTSKINGKTEPRYG